ncbi:hypothetical protein V2J09_005522 [Rumex salicifolius]
MAISELLVVYPLPLLYNTGGINFKLEFLPLGSRQLCSINNWIAAFQGKSLLKVLSLFLIFPHCSSWLISSLSHSHNLIYELYFPRWG